MGFPSIKLGEIVDVKGGKRLPKGEVFVDQITPHPYIRARDVRDGKITFDTPVYISEETHSKISRYITNAGDVCITIVGANVGDVGQVPAFLDGANLTENTVKLISDSEYHVPGYIKYALLTNDAQKQMKNFAAGAAQPKLGIYKIKEVEIPYPDFATRQEIDRILEQYDNLIENNNRRIAILEDMAQSLYREWFVKFRFPGYQDCEFKESELGLIPEGWEVKTASDVIEIGPKTSLPKEGEKPFVPMPSISTTSMIINDIEMRAGNGGTKFKNGDTLFARITPCLQNGKIGYVQFLDQTNPIGFGSTEFIVLRSKSLTPEFVYCLSRSNDFRAHAINSMAGADGRQRVKNECFNSFYLASPTKNLLDKFTEIAEPSFREIFTLNQKNKNLRKQRDLLLPKLISGSIALEGGNNDY